jgi:hypothetical protein
MNMVNFGYHMNIVFKPGVLIRSSFEVVSDVTYIHTYIHTYIGTESAPYTNKKIDILPYKCNITCNADLRKCRHVTFIACINNSATHIDILEKA